ncbi:MAG: Xaa-Pro aminopeptidase [Pseudomonadota bacterium]
MTGRVNSSQTSLKQPSGTKVSPVARREFSSRRRRLMAMLEPNSIAIVPAAQAAIRTRDTEYRFRQNNDFYYLTGFEEPNAVAVFIPGRQHGEYVLFCQERDPHLELWHGAHVGTEMACERFGADDAFPLADIDDILPGLIEGRSHVYYSMGRSAEFDARVMAWVNSLRSKVAAGAQSPGGFMDLDRLVHELRLYKSAAELRQLRRSAEISVLAHRRAMRQCRPGLFEYQLEAELVHEFAVHGARDEAYTTIVAGGKNACTMHYVSNRDRLRSGDLVLIDAGCEYELYASDITRTFPVNGRFTRRQKQLYKIVLAAQEAAFSALKPGRDWNEPHTASVEVITCGLLELGLLKGRLSTLLEREAYRKYYPHRVGHWLGLDVHDVGEYRLADAWRILECGMVLTIEPGIYIPIDDETVPAPWRGMGVRIEDNVAITANGYDLLTSGLPRSTQEVEAWMNLS